MAKKSPDDWVSVVQFRGLKTNKIITRKCGSSAETLEEAQRCAISLYRLTNDINRLVSIETKRRRDWTQSTVSLPPHLRGMT
jgi:hypothetical protein|tara:strand:- start:445 stop:690 length:246 start_codon:yes stop_codon:yes gene_type:complete